MGNIRPLASTGDLCSGRPVPYLFPFVTSTPQSPSLTTILDSYLVSR